jgi:HK97 family phage portal protein
LIVRTRGGGHREYRANNPFAQDYIPTPAEFGPWHDALTGTVTTPRKAAGIPAVLDAVRLVAESIASLPFRVYTGIGADKQTAAGSWQWTLLHEEPNEEQSPFDFWYDVAACVETHGNAYVYKEKAGAVVKNLFLMDPATVQVERNRQTQTKEYVIRPNADGREMRLTSATVLHVRGLTLKGADIGTSPIALCQQTLGASTNRYAHEREFFLNHAEVPGVIEGENIKTRKDALETAQMWAATHGGPAAAGKVAVIGNGSTYRQLALTMRDAEFIDSHKFSVEDIARMFAMPPSMLGSGPQADVEQDTKRFLSFGLGSRLGRIQAAVKRDRDLFPGASGLYPEFYTRNFIRLDAATEAEVRHKDVQSGVLLADEARADLGLPPLPDGVGQIPQIVPVGGSPAGVPVPASNGNGNG